MGLYDSSNALIGSDDVSDGALEIVAPVSEGETYYLATFTTSDFSGQTGYKLTVSMD
jgi:hypothetical protein